MKTTLARFAVASGTFLALFSSNAYPGTELTLLTKSTGLFGKTERMKVFAEGNYILVDFETNGILWNTATQSSTYLNHEKKEYVTVSKAERVAAGKMIKQQFDASLNNSTHGNPVAAQLMIKGIFAKLAAQNNPKLTRRAAGSRTVVGVSCQGIDFYEGNQKVGSSCIVQGEIAHTLTAVYEMLKTMTVRENPVAAEFAGATLESMEKQLHGVPIQQLHYSGGRETYRREVIESHNGALSAGRFTIPADYRNARS